MDDNEMKDNEPAEDYGLKIKLFDKIRPGVVGRWLADMINAGATWIFVGKKGDF